MLDGRMIHPLKAPMVLGDDKLETCNKNSKDVKDEKLDLKLTKTHNKDSKVVKDEKGPDPMLSTSFTDFINNSTLHGVKYVFVEGQRGRR